MEPLETLRAASTQACVNTELSHVHDSSHCEQKQRFTGDSTLQAQEQSRVVCLQALANRLRNQLRLSHAHTCAHTPSFTCVSCQVWHLRLYLALKHPSNDLQRRRRTERDTRAEKGGPAIRARACVHMALMVSQAEKTPHVSH